MLSAGLAQRAEPPGGGGSDAKGSGQGLSQLVEPSGQGEQRARPSGLHGERGKLRPMWITGLLPGPWPDPALQDRAQPSARLLPLISLEGQPVAMAIADWPDQGWLV